ncbi:MAG: DNA polymerase III subunit alpha [Pseudozobellia sp.]|nr:DNA polymerase III subunit alpha [Pseudozobellia sp.]MBG48030.1 DNA polymerase III subunit alpha [Pseudozobellia sp.]|tara:strand:- start:14418 stop:17438 length:3021 start_codon:yes stop_codon:yes gene_type:complete
MYLNCHTYYSLRFGTFSELDLLQLGKGCGLKELVLTDINNTSACLNFIRKAPEFGIRPMVGIDFRNGAKQLYLGIAKNNDGFRELNSFLSIHSHQSKPLPEVAPEFENVFIIYPFEQLMLLQKTTFRTYEYIGISIENLRRLPFSPYREAFEKWVVQQPVTFRNKRDFNAHRLLRAIDNNTLLSKLQTTEEGRPSERMLPLEELSNTYAHIPGIWENTRRLLSQCSIDFQFGAKRVSQNLQVFGKSKESDFNTLKNLCQEGLPSRYPDANNQVRARLQRELKVIQEMDFVSYFLINHDIITYAKNKGYFHVGRGSGANSIVAYIIGITDVDPIELDLYFERFINPFRASPPDFDIDFSWKDRDDITDYIFKKHPNAALLATYNTFKYRATVRELGKVFGLPKSDIDQLSDGSFNRSKMEEIHRLVLKYGSLIQGMPNHLSVHSAGILILERPIHFYSATDLPPKGFPTVQFDMIIAEDAGIFKFDILGQRGLAKIKEAIEIVKENRPDLPEIDISQIEKFKKDDNLNNLLAQGKAIGVYYVESPAMRGLMKKLKVRDYLSLVAASSVIRPGVSSSGMKTEFIRRHREPERRKEAHPILAQIMPETYGVMVYQEDVLKVAHEFAGLDLGEADVLRRGMSGKFRSREEFQAVELKFRSNCLERGYSEEIINEVWEQISSFAGYAFAKGHSASYAVESYQSLYLKHYFPLEFMVAVLNNGGGFYSSEHYIHEARMCGGIIHAPCINHSEHANCIKGKNIYLGFGYLKNLETLLVQRLLTERQLYGRFESLDDFVDRVTVSLEQLTILVRIGAFRFTGKSKPELLWEAAFKLNALGKRSAHPQLFRPDHRKFVLPSFDQGWLEDAYDEMELLGFPLCDYFDLISEKLLSKALAKDMGGFSGKEMLLYGNVVNTRFHTTSQGKRMRLSTFIDQEGDYFDAVHFPSVVEKYQILGRGIYACYGKITEEFGHFSMDVIWTKKLHLKPDPRSSDEPKYEDFFKLKSAKRKEIKS